MKFILLFLFLVFGQAVNSQTFQKSVIDSLARNAKSRKEKRILRNSFDSRIKENLIGSWKTINSTLHFIDKNSVRIEYIDSISFDRKYSVKDGIIIIVEEKGPTAVLDYKIQRYYYVNSISPYRIEWNYPDRRKFTSAIKL